MAWSDRLRPCTARRHWVAWSGILLAGGVLGAQPPAQYAKDLFAVQVKTASSPAERGLLAQRIEKDLGARLFHDDTSKRYGILLLAPPPHSTPSRFASSLNQWKARNPDVNTIPVYVTEDGYAVPTGKIVVEFTEHTSSTEAMEFLDHAGLRVKTAPTVLRPERYVVEPLKAQNFDPKSVAAALSNNPKIRFAEADLLMIHASERPLTLK